MEFLCLLVNQQTPGLYMLPDNPVCKNFLWSEREFNHAMQAQFNTISSCPTFTKAAIALSR